MSDSRLRELERRWQESGGQEEEAVFLRGRMRMGNLSADHVQLASVCGHPAARLVTDAFPVITDWTEEDLQKTLQMRVLLIACSAVQPLWNLRHQMQNPLHWLEAQGGKHHQWFDDEHHRQLILEVSLWRNGVKHEHNMSVPANAQVREYPSFYASQHWTALVNSFRDSLFILGIELQVNQETQRVLRVIEEYLEGKRPNIRGYCRGGMDPETLGIAWVFHLMYNAWSLEEHHFVSCLKACHSFIIKPELTEIINQEIAAWALT